MTAFEDFVQVELPKRPFTETDPSAETIFIRRGAGPRQAIGLTLSDDEIVVKKSGTLVAGTVDGELTIVDGGFY